MIKVENMDVWGFEGAIRGMRNAMNSWDKSDSFWCCEDCPHVENNTEPALECNDGKFGYCIGYNDLKLMRQLAKAGSDHSKFLRMIHVQFDLTAPLYWWKQFDQYKVGVTTDSTSTMHKIHAKKFTLDDFSTEHLRAEALRVVVDTVDKLNHYRNKYLETKSENFWWQMIQLLPSTYNQLRTVDTNYQALWTMYQARQGHKLDEWRQLCTQFEALPYFSDIFLDY